MCDMEGDCGCSSHGTCPVKSAIFARWVAAELLPPARRPACGPVVADAPGGVRTAELVADVAGGKGLLSEALLQQGFRAALVDPCALSGRDTQSAGHFGPVGSRATGGGGSAVGRGSSAQPDATEHADAPAADEEMMEVAKHLEHPEHPCGILVRRQTLQHVLDCEPELLQRCAAVVGMHPDEATEGAPSQLPPRRSIAIAYLKCMLRRVGRTTLLPPLIRRGRRRAPTRSPMGHRPVLRYATPLPRPPAAVLRCARSVVYPLLSPAVLCPPELSFTLRIHPPELLLRHCSSVKLSCSRAHIVRSAVVSAEWNWHCFGADRRACPEVRRVH